MTDSDNAIKYDPKLVSFEPTDNPVMMQVVYAGFAVPDCIMFVLDQEYGWVKLAAIRMLTDRFDMMSAHTKLALIAANARI